MTQWKRLLNRQKKFLAKVGEYLREGIEQLKLSKQLTTIKKDVALDFGIEDLQVEPRDEAKIHELFTELEFKTLIKSKVDKSTSKAKPTEPPDALKERTSKIKRHQRQLRMHS